MLTIALHMYTCMNEISELFGTVTTDGQMNNKMIVFVYGCEKEYIIYNK